MSLALSPLSIAPAVQPSARPAERGSDPETPVTGSFGEALSRASQSADEPAAKPRDKATAHPTTRRQGGPTKDSEEPADPAIVAGLALMALYGRTPPPPLGGAAAAALRSDSLPTQDAAALPGADTDVTVPIEPAGVVAVAAPGVMERGQLTLNTRKETTPLVAAPDAAQTAVPRMTLDAPTAESDAAALSGAATDVTVPTEPAGVVALAAQSARERGQPLLNTRKDTSLPVGASDSAQTTVPRMALDAPTTESPALRSPERPAAVAPEQKAAPGTIAALPASGFAEPAAGAEASSVTGPAMMAPAAQGPANIGGSVLPAAVLAPSLSQDVGSSEWDQALGQQLLHMGRADQKTAELQLNPPGLGPLKVTLSMNEHQIQVAFVSAHASVRAAVEAALPQLRAAMADGGISLGEASVGSESRQPADAGYGQEGRSGQRSYPGSSARELASGPERVAAEPRRQRSGAGVDIYA
ncbi:flagellar hook-length control protein FliK [Polaromonas sp.]|uniref:flagellar hook-length control protein FliK n=1 Tax=Polaromonas sp. TaxID=1869339 RepID=UPI003563BE76